MKLAIPQIEQLIKYHENQRDRQLEFYESDKFKSQMHKNADLEFVAENTRNVYAELIGHLTEALNLIKKHVEVDEVLTGFNAINDMFE